MAQFEDEKLSDGSSPNTYDPTTDPDEWIKVRAYWKDFLVDWERELYYPIFAKLGYTKNAALEVYTMCRINNTLKNAFPEHTGDDPDTGNDSYEKGT